VNNRVFLPERNRVLVAEDEYFLADDMARLLDEHGATVIGPVACAQEALSIASDHGVDCAVLDINLRGCRSDQVARLLRARGVPFVFATGYEEGEVAEDLREIRVYQKPFNVCSLVEDLLVLVNGGGTPGETA